MRSTWVVRSLVCALAGSVWLVTGCGAPRSDAPLPVHLIGEASPPILDDRALGAVETVAWRFVDGADPGWADAAGRPLEVGSHGASLVAGPADTAGAALRSAAARDPSEIDVVEVLLWGVGSETDLVLWWRIEGEEAVHELSCRGADAVGPPGRRYRFDLRGDERWRGTLDGFGLHTGRSGPGTAQLVEVVASRFVAGEAAPAETAGRPWRIAVGDVVRIGWLAPPGVVHEVENLDLPAGARLQVAAGATAPLAEPVTFVVEAVGPIGGVRTVLREEVDLRSARWQALEAPLEGLSGDGSAPVDLRFRIEASSPGPETGPGAVPAWGSPMVVPQTSAADRRHGPPNIVLLSVDTLRADRLSMYGNPRTTSPRLDDWASRRAVRFTEAVAAAPWTLPSHASMLSGLDGPRHGVNHWYDTTPETLDLLPERLRSAGYTTAAFTGGAWLDPRFGLGQGFDRLRGWPTVDGRSELPAAVDAAIAAMGELPEPFFLFLHTFAVHDYGLGASWPAGADAHPPEALRRAYDDAIERTDRQLGRLLDVIEAGGGAARTAVFLTSDHGESLGDKGGRGHFHLYENNLLVPLVVALPGARAAGTVVPHAVRSVDIVPTALALAGLAEDPSLDGRSLLPLIEGRPEPPRMTVSYAPATERGIALRLRGVKLIYNHVWGGRLYGRRELYRLREDPEERFNRFRQPVTETLLARAGALLAEQPPGLWLRLANSGPVPLRGVLRGALLAESTLTAFALPEGALVADGARAVRFVVRPGERYDLSFEHVPTGLLGVTIAREGGAPFETELELAGDALPRIVELDGDGWREVGTSPGDLHSGLAVWWRGPASPVSSPIDADASLRRQLQSLGYLE